MKVAELEKIIADAEKAGYAECKDVVLPVIRAMIFYTIHEGLNTDDNVAYRLMESLACYLDQS